MYQIKKTNRVGQGGDERDNAVISDDGKILFIHGNLRDSTTDGSSNLSMFGVQKPYNNFQSTNKRAHHLTAILETIHACVNLHKCSIIVKRYIIRLNTFIFGSFAMVKDK